MTLDGVNRRKVTAEERAVPLKAEKWSDARGVHRGERDGQSVGKLGIGSQGPVCDWKSQRRQRGTGEKESHWRKDTPRPCAPWPCTSNIQQQRGQKLKVEKEE